MTWLPGDDELDAIARGIPASQPAASRAEENRTALLAAAAERRQAARRGTAPWWIGGIALAAAAAIVVWVARPGSPQQSKLRVVASDGAHWRQIDALTIELDDGALSVGFDPNGRDGHARVIAPDGSVETGAAELDVRVAEHALADVHVTTGQATLALRQPQQVIVLAAGESWSSTKTAQIERGTIVPSAEQAVPPPAPEVPPPAPEVPPPAPEAPPPAEHHDVRKPDHKVRAPDTMVRAPDTAVRAPDTTVRAPDTTVRAPDAGSRKPEAGATPGEAEFRDGWNALRAGDAARAARSFATACQKAQRDALGDDACFWAGAAAKRAGDAHTARAALAQFLAAFPASARAGEAAALLGWILVDAGELDAAEKLFHQAEHDRVPQVRESATRGLDAIARRR